MIEVSYGKLLNIPTYYIVCIVFDKNLVKKNRFCTTKLKLLKNYVFSIIYITLTINKEINLKEKEIYLGPNTTFKWKS